MRTLYQKLKRPHRPFTSAAAAARRPADGPVPMPRPLCAAVHCANCRAEAIFQTVVAEWQHPVDAQSAATWRHQVVIEPYTDHSSLVWFFPRIVPPRTPGASRFLSLYRGAQHGNLGVLECTTCGTQRPHMLDWPRQAFYRIDLGRACLWAVNRADLIELREYIAAKNRRQMYRSGAAHYATRYLPREVIIAKNRERILTAIDTLLARS